MPIILLLVVIVIILLGGAGLVFGALWALFVLLWAALPWIVGVAGVMFVVALIRGTFGTVVRSKPPRQTSDRNHQEPRIRPHVVTDEVRAAMAEQQRLNAEYRDKIAAAKKARGG